MRQRFQFPASSAFHTRTLGPSPLHGMTSREAVRRPREAENLRADRQLATQMHAVRKSGAFRVSHFLRSLISIVGVQI
jgi:hypothetical protein